MTDTESKKNVKPLTAMRVARVAGEVKFRSFRLTTRWRRLAGLAAIALLGAGVGVLAALPAASLRPAAAADHGDESPTAGWEADLPPGIWTRLHRMRADDPARFRLQSHGGSAFDTRRGRIVLFGSDSHGLDWSNAPRIFDPASLSWRQVHPDDPPSRYRVDGRGIPVAGPGSDPQDPHPWAMHAFGAVDYDERRDAIVIASHPAHMEPGRFSDALAGIWPQVRRHPTWIFDLKRERWTPLPAADTSFFAYSTAYDNDRGIMIGAARHGLFELSGDPAAWKRTAEGAAIGYHSNTAYDRGQRALVIFGRNGLGNDVLVYRPDKGAVTAMPTPGPRPPRDEHAPMAYHPRLGESLVLVDRFPPGVSRASRSQGRAETWAYDLGRDRWRRIAGANLPFALGMNYNLHYDPARDLLFLITAAPPVAAGEDPAAPEASLPEASLPEAGLPEVWVLRL